MVVAVAPLSARQRNVYGIGHFFQVLVVVLRNGLLEKEDIESFNGLGHLDGAVHVEPAVSFDEQIDLESCRHAHGCDALDGVFQVFVGNIPAGDAEGVPLEGPEAFFDQLADFFRVLCAQMKAPERATCAPGALLTGL
jgi:hypothetical protein